MSHCFIAHFHLTVIGLEWHMDLSATLHTTPHVNAEMELVQMVVGGVCRDCIAIGHKSLSHLRETGSLILQTLARPICLGFPLIEHTWLGFYT